MHNGFKSRTGCTKSAEVRREWTAAGGSKPDGLAVRAAAAQHVCGCADPDEALTRQDVGFKVE